MRWTYLLLINSDVHAEMRVFQVVDSQQVPVLEFSGRRSGGLLTMTVVIESDEPRVRRIEALLARLQPILRVDCFPAGTVIRGEVRRSLHLAPREQEPFGEGAD